MASSEKSAAKATFLGKRKLEDDLETKPFMRKHNETDTTKGFVDSLQQIKGSVELSEKKSDEANAISLKDETVEGLDETPDFVQQVAVPNKTLFLANLSSTIKIPNIIDFFKDVAQVVNVRLMLNHKCEPLGCGFVEFASANEAKMALQKKNGEYLNNRQIFLDAPNKGSTNLTPKFCIDHKFWYEEDYLQGVNLPIGDDAAVKGLDETPHLDEDVLLIANLSPQTTRIEHFINFFKDVGEVMSVRLIVNDKCKHVGYGFVEFASSNVAKKALEVKNGKYLDDHKILLMKGLHETLDFVEEDAVRNKTLFVGKISFKTEMSDIINFFKDVGEVVHVRLIVDDYGKPSGDGFVEFASPNQAKKAMEKKNGEYLHNRKISLEVFETPPPYYRPPRFCMDHKVWYEDYLQRESLVIEEDAAAVERLDETPDYAEEVSVHKKLVFVRQLHRGPVQTMHIISKLKHAGEVIRIRIIVDRWGEHVGCCFVELATANAAKKAVGEYSTNYFSFHMAEMAAPHPFRPNYNLAEKIWYEDNLRRESLFPEEKGKIYMSCGKKTIISDEW